MKTTPSSITDQLHKTQNFIWNGLNPKIKNLTINNNYKNGGLQNVNTLTKISAILPLYSDIIVVLSNK